MYLQAGSIRSIRLLKIPVACDQVTNRTGLSFNTRSMHSCKSLGGLTAMHALCSDYKKATMTASEFVQQWASLPPFLKHTRIDQINTFSRQFLRVENLFGNSGLKQLAQKLHKESHENQLDQDCLCGLVERVLSCCTTHEIYRSYEHLRDSCEGFSLQAMTLNFGVHLYMVSSRYTEAHALLNELLKLILKHDKDEYLAVYLRLRIIALCNQNETQRALGYLKKLVKVAWLFHLTDLELWCYHQMSKLYLMEHEQQLARVMNSKAEEGVSEGTTKYRSIMCELIAEEIVKMKKARNDFDLASEEIDVLMMRREHHLEPAKSELSLKQVRLLATKLHRNGTGRLKNLLPKLFRERRKTKDQEEVQISLMMTHLSKLKNFNCFFRGDTELRTSSDGLITIENPSVNWQVLREMLRCIAKESLPSRC